MKLHSTKARPAFTLIELIVVMSIIALLATITISAVFRLQSSQKESNTVTHLTKIQMTFNQQWKPTIDNIKKQEPPIAIRNATADGVAPATVLSDARARALHMKLLLRREFPQTFNEARLSTNGTVNTNPYNAQHLVQYHDRQAIVVNPPALPIGDGDMDKIYDLPYTRRPHPSC